MSGRQKTPGPEGSGALVLLDPQRKSPPPLTFAAEIAGPLNNQRECEVNIST